ncbi:hypothetical protein BDF19DRAFT_467314 [Syncephalis fuscata]|nr:hypothetical protein BDF19DRAFT_467314 [Syncephalis fuscata]
MVSKHRRVELSDFERQRVENIQRNEELLAQLGLSKKETIKADNDHSVNKTSSRSIRRRVLPIAAVLKPSRASKRLRGEAPLLKPLSNPEDLVEKRQIAAELEDKENENDKNDENDDAWNKLSRGFKWHLSFRYKSMIPRCISAPLTLWSIGTTIWDIGHLVTDERKLQFWSNRACMFHHPYPVGYRASKYHFGREYWMTIEADEDGPIFAVFTEDRQHNFEGRTPTQPWTQACLASTTKGTRISGPLLHGYQSWEDLHAEAATAMAPTAAATTTTTLLLLQFLLRRPLSY